MSDTPTPTPTDAFEQQRDRLRAIAYRMLGSHADADDVVQEAWLRLSQQDAAEIGNLAGWLTTVVARLSLDVLRTRQTHPVASSDVAEERMLIVFDEAPAPDEDAVLADAVGQALLVVLDSLAPNERLAFVLHDLFAVSFDEIGRILGRSEDAAKMTASRARRKVRAGQAPPPAAAREQRAVVDAFLAAAREGDFEALLRVLDPAVRLNVDTPGGKVVLLGATEVASGARRAAGAATRGVPVYVNGRPGFAAFGPDGRPLSVMVFRVAGGRIVEMDGVADPARLAAMEVLGAARVDTDGAEEA